uniref:Uncharacterized protein n=1 Tax=Globisporangium ultimum (strain ATCC 200006 / CBS 805.95 / DAOM BR144) TaxID=431595 RepID=K3X5H1_GLOUD
MSGANEASKAVALVLAFLVPGIGTTIGEALVKLASLSMDMRENQELCDQVTERMRALYEEILRIENGGALRKNKRLSSFKNLCLSTRKKILWNDS